MPSGVYKATSETEPIVAIQFGIFSPDEIEKRSVVEVTSYHTYDGNEPRINGLFDPRMGVLDNGKTCRSCGQTNHHCPGHFGHYKLARPVYFIQFMPFILNTLSCVCIRCAKLLIDKETHKKVLKKRGEARWRELLKMCSTITRCGQDTEDGCGAKKPTRFLSEGIARIKAEWTNPTDKISQPLEVEYVLRLFRRITDEDVDFLGLSRHWCRPDWMVCSVLPIPPPQVRPSVVQDNNQRSEDDLTHKLFELIKSNQILQQKIDANADRKLIDEMTDVLQYHVATLVNNKLPGVAPSAQRSGRPLKSIQQRLGTKEGRIRYNIQGKRVEFSARSVITPDPNLSIGELGVPIKIAMNLTFPEKVTQYNKAKLYKLVQNGADTFPGAKTVVSADGRMTSLRHVNTKEIVLYDGDTVNRHLMDGDIVLFNRQPTLHRMSMMGHRVKVLPYNTFRLNVMVCAPYNADFDGDEMNAHIPQSYEAAVELGCIAAVEHQIITPRDSKPVIGVVQDTLVGAYRLTRPGNLFNKREIFNLMMWNKKFDGNLKEPGEGGKWTGAQVMSTLLPPINMTMTNKLYNSAPDADKEYEDRVNIVKIKEGEVLQGTFDKDVFSKAGKGIIHVTYNDYGSKDTVTLLDTLQNTIEQFLIYNGFSVGISDLVADDSTRTRMEEEINIRKKKIEEIILEVHQNVFNNNTGKTNRAEFEDRVFTAINEATNEAGKIGLQSLADENRMTAMIRAGSKGSQYNVAQMIACVGQQAIEGKRVPYGFTDRTLPHFKKYDDGAEARGFIESSFVRGLTPSEFFFHAMSGREGLIDTAVKSVTGDTPIIIIEDGFTKRVCIGDWIDAQLSASAIKVEHFEERDLELLQLVKPVYIPTADENGKVTWGEITAITRHDPGDQLYEIKTLGGKSVIVTESKSLLIWDSATSTFQRKSTPEVKPGDFVPVTKNLPSPPITSKVKSFVNSSDYLLQAITYHPEDIKNIIENNTFTQHNDEVNMLKTIIGVSQDTYKNIQSHNDCILDEIVEINIVSVEKYPKVYDLTVPSTLNFGLANGLHVVDTADTGYIQRQLVKSMEDLITHFDNTVRDAKGNIIQFHYGEDGVNATKIEGQGLPLGKLTEEDIRKIFSLEGVDMTPMLQEGAVRESDVEQLSEYVEQILEDRKMLVEMMFGGGSEIPITSPVNLERFLTNMKVRFGLKSNGTTDLTPIYVLNGIDTIIKKTQPFNVLWKALLRYHLAPHNIIIRDRFTKKAFDTLIELIIVRNWKSWALPGEQVGIIAAQSIGEPATQMCVMYASQVCINSQNTKIVGPIGKFIDELLRDNSTKVIPFGNNSLLLDLTDDYYIASVSKEEKNSWKRISQVSRHRTNGGIVKITTRSKRTTTATLSHSFLVRAFDGVTNKKGSDLKVGDRVPIARSIPEVPFPHITLYGFQLNKEFGWLCGIYLADGSFSGNSTNISKISPIVEEKIRAIAELYRWNITVKNYQGEYGPSKTTAIYSKELKDFLLANFGTGSYEKFVGSEMFHTKKDFIAGIIGGYFDGDGNVNTERQQIRVGSRSECLIRDINKLLAYCGIFGVVGQEESARIPDKIMHTLNILKKYSQTYKDIIGFAIPEKKDGLDVIIEYMEREDKHSCSEVYDKIPELGEIIAETGKILRMPGQSRTYGRWTKKESIGRLTLEQYVENFKDMMNVHVDEDMSIGVDKNMKLLEQALYADVVWDEIIDLEYFPDPEVYVYDFTVPGNESFMVDDCIMVHNTLNSVDWDTKILIAKDGKIQTPQIGEFIDNYYKECDQEKVQHLPNGQIYIPLDDGSTWEAVSTDENGKMMWTQLEAITRHPVVNDDGTNTILKVTMQSGRTVKATKGKSFLTLQNGLIHPSDGADLKVGDMLPIATSLAIDSLPTITEINLRNILPATEYLYGSEVEIALSEMKKYKNWFQHGQGTLFTIPYNRSDSFRDSILNGRNSNATSILPGFVYPKRTRENVSQIPESIPLTKDFGFFVGAYIAEGTANTTQVNISNNDINYLNKVRSLMDLWNIGTHIVKADKESKKTGIKGTSTSLIIHSTILAKVMLTFFGRISSEKTFPDWVLQSPKDFAEGLLDGYISGDGTISKHGQIYATSISRILLEKVGILLARFNIFTTMTSRMPDKGVFDSVHENYTIAIPTKWSKIFHQLFTLTIELKEKALEHFHSNSKRTRDSWNQMEDMVWDSIKSIEEVVPMGEGWVYDVTVAKTRTFTGANMMALNDTFHLAGVAAKSNVTRGVPRLKELLKVTKSPKATTLTVYLKPEFRERKEKAREVSQDLELTLLRDITIKAAIYYDPSMDSTALEEDKELVSFYKLFEERMNETTGDDEEYSKLVLRLEFDREKMFNKNISMDDIAFVLKTNFESEVHMVYSDYNSQKLIMRIRILPQAVPKGESNLDYLLMLKKFQNKILNGIVIRGLAGIKTAPFRFLSKELEQFRVYKDGKYDTIQEYVIDTDGSNFLEVANHPCVDGSRVTSSHVHDILPYLGIEATRSILMSELTTLFSEVGINSRHVGLLTDVMTRGGRLMSIDRYGINKMDIGPLAKASFEETEKILLRAAVFGEMDPVTGVSANIMTGQAIRGGTAFSQILLDETMFMKLQETVEYVAEEDTDEELDEEMIGTQLHEDPNERCSSTRLTMNMVLPNADILLDEEDDIEINVLD